MTATLESLFEPGLLDRLRGQYEHVDVYALAGQVRDMIHRGKTVRKPNGLLVSWVRKASREQAVAIGTANAKGRDELERYAEFHSALYRAVALDQLGPRQIADCLAQARAEGFGRINPFVIDALEQLGEQWPEEA